MTPLMPLSTAAADLGLGLLGQGNLPGAADEESKKRRKEDGTAGDQRPGTYGDPMSMSAAAAALFGGVKT